MVINVQNKILHNLLPILNTLPNGVIPAARHSKTKKIFICFAMRSPCTTLLRQVRRRFGSKNESFWTFILYFSRLALTLNNLGCGSAQQNKKNLYLFCYALALH